MNNTTEDQLSNSTNVSLNSQSAQGMTAEILIPLYSIIFLLSIVGNCLIIITLVQQRQMRTVTNIYLLNLSIADLLLTIFCMPFTLVATLMRNFIFGTIMCHIIPLCQTLTVAVSVFTLVVISIERYFAICRPLHSRTWQTIRHATKLIIVVWILGVGISIPSAVFRQLVPVRGERYKCVEHFPLEELASAYSLTLLVVLFILPLIIMLVAYGLIGKSIFQQISNGTIHQHGVSFTVNHTVTEDAPLNSAKRDDMSSHEIRRESEDRRRATTRKQSRRSEQLSVPVQSNNLERALRQKRRVIRMLFVVVLEFFISWTPLFVLQTISSFQPAAARRVYLLYSFALLLAYISTCCNPITYCFMSRNFRSGFLAVFRCGRSPPNQTRIEESMRLPRQSTVYVRRRGSQLSAV